MALRLVLVSAIALGCALLLPNYADYSVEAADLPCESKVVPTAPRPPTGVRIITTLLKPLFDGVSLFAATVTNTYFETLATRAECLSAYSLRSQEQLDALETTNKFSDKKKPMVYDPIEDAAKITVYPPESTDIQGKYMPVRVGAGTMLLTFDFKFDDGWRWLGEGYMQRHKTWRFMPGPWLAIRTDYRHAANVGEFGEVFFTMPGARFLAPGTTRGAPGWFGEMLQPALASFYYQPNTWVRVWVFVDGLDREICSLSIWVADEKRDPVQLYNNIALYSPIAEGGLSHFQIEYDTSADSVPNPTKNVYSWNRNVVVLHNLSKATVTGLLKRPGL